MTKKTKKYLLIAGACVGGYYLYTRSQAKAVVAAPKDDVGQRMIAMVTNLFKPANEHAQKVAMLEGTGSLGSLGGTSLSACNGPFGCDSNGSLG